MTGSAPLVMEVLAASPRRRRWSEPEKQRLVAETFEPGMNVSLVARRRGVDPSLLFRWRRRLVGPVDPPPVFAPVEVVPEQPERSPAVASAPAAGGSIEIELSGGHRLRVDRHVDADALRRVLGVLEGAR